MIAAGVTRYFNRQTAVIVPFRVNERAMSGLSQIQMMSRPYSPRFLARCRHLLASAECPACTPTKSRGMSGLSDLAGCFERTEVILARCPTHSNSRDVPECTTRCSRAMSCCPIVRDVLRRILPFRRGGVPVGLRYTIPCNKFADSIWKTAS